jgi:DegV family protein with EDD domain
MSPGSVAIVVDSTAFLPRPLVEQYGIHVVPNVVNWGAQTFRDGVDIQPSEFFERLKRDPVMPTTAVASVGEFRDIYAKAAESADAVVGVHISAKLSGTYSAAEQAKAMLPDARIEIVDSESTAMALGFVALAAARAAAQGASQAEVAQAARNTIPHVGLLFTVETLDYLRRGGRIGGASAFIGNLMDVKPILELKDARVEPMERARSKKKAIARILEVMAERIAGKAPVRLATIHAAADAEARALLDTAAERLGATEAILAEASPTVAVHAGPGTVGLAWCAGA